MNVTGVSSQQSRRPRSTPQFGTSCVQLPKDFNRAQTLTWFTVLLAQINHMLCLLAQDASKVEPVVAGVGEQSTDIQVYLRHGALLKQKEQLARRCEALKPALLAEANRLVAELNAKLAKLGGELWPLFDEKAGPRLLQRAIVALCKELVALGLDGEDCVKLHGAWVTPDDMAGLVEANIAEAAPVEEVFDEPESTVPDIYSAADAARYKGQWTPSMEPGCGRAHVPFLSNSGWRNPRPWHIVC